MTLGRDLLLWVIFLANAVITAWSESEIVWVFLLSGVAALFMKAPPRLGRKAVASAIMPLPAWLLSGLHGTASAGTLWTLGLYFAEAGAFVFGSGLAIVPFLYGGVVDRFHWLSDHQFLDAVAVAMITPGPVVITVAFIGTWSPARSGPRSPPSASSSPVISSSSCPPLISGRSPRTGRSRPSWTG
jgi:chromate transporter